MTEKVSVGVLIWLLFRQTMLQVEEYFIQMTTTIAARTVNTMDNNHNKNDCRNSSMLKWMKIIEKKNEKQTWKTRVGDEQREQTRNDNNNIITDTVHGKNTHSHRICVCVLHNANAETLSHFSLYLYHSS